MAYLISRLREPSTYAGAAAIAAAFGLVIPGEWMQAGVAAGVALGGVLAVIVPEQKE
jgi:hypothetical protein